MDPTQALNFEIGCASTAFTILKELFIQLKGVAKVGELINFHACTDIMDLLYEKEETSRLSVHTSLQFQNRVGISYTSLGEYLMEDHIILHGASAAGDVKLHRGVWFNVFFSFVHMNDVKLATSCSEEYIQGLVKVILRHIFANLLTSGDKRKKNIRNIKQRIVDTSFPATSSSQGGVVYLCSLMAPPVKKMWKRAVGAIKDKNSLWVASISRRSVYCNPDLEAAIIKATSHDETRIDYKSAQCVYVWIRTSPAFNLKPLIWSLSYRMDRTRSWVVAIKGLMLLHGVFCCKIPMLDKIGRLPFDLSNFSHSHSSVNKTWGYDAFVHDYFTFLDQKSVFLCAHRDPKSRIRLKESRKDRPIMGDIQMLLKAQSLLDSLLQIRPQMECMKRVCLILEAMDCVIIEIFDVYSKVCSFIAGVLSKIYSATRTEASMALSVLRQANVQGDELSRYFELCQSIGVLNVSEFLKVERIPEEDIQEVERIVNEISSGRKNQEAEKGLVPVVEKAITPLAKSTALTTVITEKWEVFEDVRTLETGANSFETSLNHQPNNVNSNKQEMPDLISF